MLYLLLGLALIGVVVFAVVLGPDTQQAALPDAVEAISPADSSTVLRQTDLVVDMSVGYEIALFVDGRAIPDSEITFVEGTGVRTWIPGPGKTFEEWTPGLHSVLVTYDRIAGGVDIGELRWVFRVQ